MQLATSSLQPGPVLHADVEEIHAAVPQEVKEFAVQLVAQRLLAAHIELHIDLSADGSVAFELTENLTHLSSLSGFSVFVAWASRWVGVFQSRLDVHRVRIKISHIRQTMCPRFHMDNVKLRLIATLVGPGSEWLRGVDVQYLPDGTISQCPAEGCVQALGEGSVGLFPGSQIPLDGLTGAVHRSPDANVDRILFTIDHLE